ncbi:uncharacterized protein LOC135491956 [Lineus longissimus]|uniref:uncharacterized protein LOC135491956 n=1 Tax=Lineus longissimus TaxID=88925 RepID=UPI002B4D86FC
MAGKRCTQHKNNIALILIFMFFLCLALAAGLVALFTDSWVTYEVKVNKTAVYNSNVDSSMLYHTRSRGLFWIVLKDPNVKLVKDRGNDARFPVQYNHNNTCGLIVSAGFWDLSAMMKASVSLHLVYLIVLGLCTWLAGFALLFGILNLKLSVIILVPGEVAGIIGMVLFHYYLMFEKSNDVPEAANTLYYFWNEFLKSNTKEYFSYSFMLQWISVGISLITIILGIIFILRWTAKEPKPHKPQPPPITYHSHDNYAYGGKEDFHRQQDIQYRPSPMPERRNPMPERRDPMPERRDPIPGRRDPMPERREWSPERRELSPTHTPVQRSWAMNGPDYDDSRRRQNDTRYDYREVQRNDRRDDFRESRQQYQPSDQPFYPRY